MSHTNAQHPTPAPVPETIIVPRGDKAELVFEDTRVVFDQLVFDGYMAHIGNDPNKPKRFHLRIRLDRMK